MFSSVPSAVDLRQELDAVLDDFMSPRGLRREIDRLLNEDLGPMSLWRELEQLSAEFAVPPPLRRRIGAMFRPYELESFEAETEGMPSAAAAEPMPRGETPRLDSTSVEMDALYTDSPYHAEMFERPGEYVFMMETPGVSLEQLDVRIEGDAPRAILVVRAPRRAMGATESAIAREPTEAKTTAAERKAPTFAELRVALPPDINATAIDAHYADGVLRIALAKAPPPERRSIPIKVGARQVPASPTIASGAEKIAPAKRV